MKRLLAIIDTNVLLSGLRSQKGQSYKLLHKLLNDEFEVAISVPLVLEYEAKDGYTQKITYTATKISLNPVSAAKFDIPTQGYRLLNE